VADAVGSANGSATLVLVGDARMRVLNRMFRGYDRPTDVLSFSSDPTEFPAEEQTYLGDIVISVETAERQAKRRGSNLARELRVLALHGFLHLLGYNHETDDGEMRRIEYRLRRKFGITVSRKKRTAAVKKARKK
jgi:probable rRNA maturation factor